MSLWLKLKLSVLCLVLLGTAAALFVALLPFLVSTDAIRLRLARDLSTITGYNVQLSEPPQISVFPAFRAALPHVVLSDNSAANAPLMDAEKIIVRMSLWDALRGRARFSETKLIRPHFSLSEPVSASALFAALARSQGSFGSAVRATQSRLNDTGGKAQTDNENAAPLFFQPFGRIIIEDGRLSYPAVPAAAAAAKPAAAKGKTTKAPAENTAPQTPAEDEISAVNAEITWPLNGSRASLSASGLWHGALTRLDISADDALLLLSGGTSTLRVSFNSVNGGITFTGKAQAGQNWTARGQVQARSPGLGQTLSWLQTRLPFGISLNTPFIWESDLKARPGAAELKQITLTIGDDTTGDSGRGALDIGYENNLPHINGSLAFEKLNLNLPAAGLFTADTQTAAKSGRLKPAMDMPAFNLLGLDLRVSIDKAQLNSIAADNVAASIQMRKSGLIFDIGAMQIFGAAAQSSLRLKSNDDRITGMDLHFSAVNADLAKLRRGLSAAAADLPAALKAQGKADINLTIQADLPQNTALPRLKPAARNAALKRQKHKTAAEEESPPGAAPTYSAIFSQYIWPYARGQLNLTVNNGRLPDFDMADFISRLQAGQPFPLQAAAPQTDAKAASFNFDRLDGRFTLDKGALAPLSIAVIFGRHRLELQGKADISGNRLALDGVLDPTKLNGSGQCADTACLRQSLSPAIKFSAKGQISAENGKAAQNIVQIAPQAEVLPY